MIEQDFIMLIMNCKKYYKKALFQKQTWLKTIPNYLLFYHVIGDETLDSEYKFDNETKILWVRVSDDYNSLPNKVITAYKAVFNTFNFKYLFKTDDDQILLNKKFFETLVGIINKSSPRLHYGGFIVDIKQNYLSQYHKIHPELPEYFPILETKYCSGRFYFLSKLAILNLLSKREIIVKEYLEDYAIGFNLDNYFKLNMLSLQTDKFFTDIETNDFEKC
jgi:hypothetical protein